MQQDLPQGPPFQHIIVQSAVVVEAFLYFYSHGFWFYCSNYFMYCSLHPPTNTTHHYFTINGWHSRRFNIFLSALIYRVCRDFEDFCSSTVQINTDLKCVSLLLFKNQGIH